MATTVGASGAMASSYVSSATGQTAMSRVKSPMSLKKSKRLLTKPSKKPLPPKPKSTKPATDSHRKAEAVVQPQVAALTVESPVVTAPFNVAVAQCPQQLDDFRQWTTNAISERIPITVHNQALLSNDPFLTTAVCSSPSAAPFVEEQPAPPVVLQDSERDLIDIWKPEALFGELVSAYDSPNDPMVCCNPLEVEGIAAALSRTEVSKKEEASGEATIEADQVNTNIKEEIVEEHNNQLAKDSQEASGEATIEARQVNTNIKKEIVEEHNNQLVKDSQEMAEENCLVAGMDFDLFDFVMDDAIPMDDPSFQQALEEPSELPALFTTIDASAIAPVSVPAAAPLTVMPTVVSKVDKDVVVTVTEPTVERPPVHRAPAASVEAPSEVGVANDDHAYAGVRRVPHQRAPRKKLPTQQAKYRRMRDLNNDASKRCRHNRKLKIKDLLEEEKMLAEKNEELKMKLNVMQEQVEALKKLFLHKIANPTSQATGSNRDQITMEFDVDDFVNGVYELRH